MTFEFHAAPPPGEWINDPNGLIYAGGRYRLFAQHSAEEPDFKRIGWARWSSDDLLHWDWDGPVIAPDATGLAYSGSVLAEGDALTAFLTRHSPPLQRQYRLASDDHGLTWQQHDEALGPEGRNVRDPFVFDCVATGDRRMIVAAPCDWTDWANEPPSRLEVWAERAECWEQVGTIGPWSPAGVMWEVPVLLDFDDAHVLVVSTVDRRDGGAACSVRYWVGRFDGRTFTTDDPVDGLQLDHGPEFYATCFNTVAGWPNHERVLIGWASSWATARTMRWPGDIHGGPLSLPRVVTLVRGRLRQTPMHGAMTSATTGHWSPGKSARLAFEGEGVGLTVYIGEDGALRAERSGVQPVLAWSSSQAHFLSRSTDIAVFIDNGLCELFFLAEGKVMTAYVPGATHLHGISQ